MADRKAGKEPNRQRVRTAEWVQIQYRWGQLPKTACGWDYGSERLGSWLLLIQHAPANSRGNWTRDPAATAFGASTAFINGLTDETCTQFWRSAGRRRC